MNWEEELALRDLSSIVMNGKEIFEKWKRERENTIRVVRELADQIQTHEKNCRIAKISGTVASVVGGCVSLGCFIGAFFTSGATLPLAVFLGSATGSAGAITVLGTDLVNTLLKNTNLDLVNKALVDDANQTTELLRTFEKLEKEKPSRNATIAMHSLSMFARFGKLAHDGVETGTRLACSGVQTGKTAFQTLSTVGRRLHIAGGVVSVIFLIPDVCSIIKTSVDVHNGKLLEVVEDLRQIAQSLEDELKMYSDKIENSPSC